MTFPRNWISVILTIFIMGVGVTMCRPGAPAEPETPPEPEVDWDRVPVIAARTEPPTYNPMDDMPEGYSADAGLPPMPPLADIGAPEPEELLSPGVMHTGQWHASERPGWCSHFCTTIGAEQLHPDAFRARLRGDFTPSAEYDSRDYYRSRDPDETYEEFTERVARGVEARFGDMPICVCEHNAGPMGQQWLLAVPREHAVFFRGAWL